MKKQILALALALIPMLVFSQHRSENDAIAVAQDFWGNKVNRAKLKAVSQSSLLKAKARNLAKTKTKQGNSKQSFYVINDNEHARFVIVASDERLLKILGYSDNGIFNPETAPSGLLDMLNDYDEQYANVYAHLDKIAKQQQNTLSYTPVQPLIHTKWDQDNPYNLQCPKDIKSSSESNCVTGCVATAMAQVMNFYKYPDYGTGSNSYISSMQRIQQSMDFSTVHFDWNNMLDVYDDKATKTQTSAVATLMHAAGVSVSMDYADVSGAYAIDMAYALHHFWKYNPNIAYKKKKYYSDDAWNKIIMKELQASHPILYAGRNGHSGHQFILDGCDQDGLYHFNFGWSGTCDGYYSLEVLVPTYDISGFQFPIADYSSDQEMVCYVSPQPYGQKEGEFYASSNIKLSREKVGSKKNIYFEVCSYDISSTIEIKSEEKLSDRIGVGVFDKDFKFVKSLKEFESDVITRSKSSFYGQIKFDAQTFEEGKQCYIALYANSDEIGYSIVRTPKGLEDYYLATVKDGYITFEPMKQMGDNTPTVHKIATGLYNAKATKADGSPIEWQINIWQDESDASKYWIADLDPIAKSKGYSYSKGCNKVFGHISENGDKLTIPTDQSIAGNIFLRNYSGGNVLTLYLSSPNKSMSLESVWGCEEINTNSDNATTTEISRLNGGRFEHTTEITEGPDTRVESPFISLSENHILTISCKTDGATIYYTTDGSQPSASSIPYAAPVEIKGNCTIKAVAIKDGLSSDISSYSVSDFSCLAPTVNQALNSNMISIQSETEGAKIYYTLDNTTPSKNSIPYTKEFEITKSCIVKAIAIKDHYNDSPVATQTVIFHQSGTPVPGTGEINVSGNVAGELASRISASEKVSATRWTISGEINGTDIAFIREAFEAKNITDLDLSNAIIVSGGKPYYKTSYLEYSTENYVVGNKMFANAKSLISLILPSTTQLIDSYSFEDCDNLATITIPDNCKEVKSSAIYFCKNLTSIQIGKNIENFEKANGDGCPKLKAINVDAENRYFTSVDGVLYNKNKDVIYKYPAGQTASTFTVPATVKTVNDYAFNYAVFEEVILPDGLEKIGISAFSNCKNLRTIDIPQTVQEIGLFAFQSCSKMTEVKIPDQVKELESMSFAFCVSLRNVHIGASINAIDGSAFSGSTSLQTFTVDPANNTYATENGILYSKDRKALVRCPLAYYSDEIILNEEIEVIKNNAFENCKNIQKIKLPNRLREIGSSAFKGSLIEAIAIPNTVEKIGSFAFQDCKKLKDFAIPTSTTSIPSFMLSYCDSLEYLYIHKDVTMIDSYAFAHAKKLNTIECWIENINNLDIKKDYYDEYDSFKDIKSDCTWHVPQGCSEAYKAQPWWISTWNIVDDLKETPDGIDHIVNNTGLNLIAGKQSMIILSSSDMIICIHNLQGHLIRTENVEAGCRTTIALPSGVYLINGIKVCIR